MTDGTLSAVRERNNVEIASALIFKLANPSFSLMRQISSPAAASLNVTGQKLGAAVTMRRCGTARDPSSRFQPPMRPMEEPFDGDRAAAANAAHGTRYRLALI